CQRRSSGRHGRGLRAGEGVGRRRAVSVRRQCRADGRVGQRSQRGGAVPDSHGAAGAWWSDAEGGVVLTPCRRVGSTTRRGGWMVACRALLLLSSGTPFCFLCRNCAQGSKTTEGCMQKL